MVAVCSTVLIGLLVSTYLTRKDYKRQSKRVIARNTSRANLSNSCLPQPRSPPLHPPPDPKMSDKSNSTTN